MMFALGGSIFSYISELCFFFMIDVIYPVIIIIVIKILIVTCNNKLDSRSLNQSVVKVPSSL